MGRKKRRTKISERDHKRGVRVAVGFFVGFAIFVVIIFSLAF